MKTRSKLHLTRDMKVSARISESGMLRETASVRTAAVRRKTHTP